MNTPTNTSSEPAPTSSPAAERLLIAGLAIGAVALGGLLASGLASGFGEGSPAYAGIVSEAGMTTILSTEVSNEDIVLVLDARTEELIAYRTDLQKGMELLQRINIPQVFGDARARASGSK